MTTWQKLLMPAQTRTIVERGLDGIGGPIVKTADVAHLRDPATLLTAYGWGEREPYGASPDFVDVIRFPQQPLMRFHRPVATGARPWPTYETGFLPTDAVIPVWSLAYTRVPTGAELWRIRADGEQRGLSVYRGPALGWQGGKGFAPPLQLIGPRAEWDGLDLPAAFTDDTSVVEVVAVGDQAPPGFEPARPQVARRAVPVADCERVFEVVLTATWRETPCRVLQRVGGETLLQLGTDDPDVARALGATMLEPGIFEVVAPSEELTDGGGSTFELDAAAGMPSQ